MDWQDVTAVVIAAACGLWAVASIVRPFLSKAGGGSCGGACGAAAPCAPAPAAVASGGQPELLQIEPCEPA